MTTIQELVSAREQIGLYTAGWEELNREIAAIAREHERRGRRLAQDIIDMSESDLTMLSMLDNAKALVSGAEKRCAEEIAYWKAFDAAIREECKRRGMEVPA